MEGLESYYTADGKYLGQVGNNVTIRVLNDDIVENDVKLQIKIINSESGYMTDHINYLESNSREAFTRDKLYGVLKKWGDEYAPLSKDKEYTMGIFELEIETNSGESKKVYMTGNTVSTMEGEDRSEVDPDRSVLKIGKKQMGGKEWSENYGGGFSYNTHGEIKRFGAVHTHTDGLESNKISFDDMSFSLSTNVIIYMFSYNSKSLFKYAPKHGESEIPNVLDKKPSNVD